MNWKTRNNTVECCPVCGMRTTGQADSLVMEYHKMYFHFCSEQCREMFQTHPGLYSSKKRAKVAGGVIKSRKLRLATVPDPETAEAVGEYLQGLMGLKKSQVTGRWLTVRYDLLQLTL
ncbi:MAG: YHS domain-containing protein, partial [Gammaproteobacteria bacterium]|nr:YHS domain-containing protein [Gammaproteobacteria bacterium]